MTRRVRVSWALVVCTAIFAANGVQIVRAAQALPRAVGVTSWYMRPGAVSDPSWGYNNGCNEGNARRANLANSEVILDFGSQVPNQSETRLPFHDGFATYATLENQAEQFAKGYYVCTSIDTTTVLKLAVGTTNDNYDGLYNNTTTSHSAGLTWSQVAQTVGNWVGSNHYSSQVQIGAASDMETEWGGQPATLAWADGYASNILAPFYLDYGDAGGCPQYIWQGGNGYGCGTNGWNQYGVWYKSWYWPPAFPLPEIYYQVNADQWWTISRYGYYVRSEALIFQGPLDEYDRDNTTLTATQAWNALSNDIQSVTHTNLSMTYSCQVWST